MHFFYSLSHTMHTIKKISEMYSKSRQNIMIIVPVVVYMFECFVAVQQIGSNQNTWTIFKLNIMSNVS